MNAFRLPDGVFPAEVRNGDPAAFADQASGFAPFGAGLPVGIEELFGAGVEPDEAFFVDSWTVGVDAASKNFLERQQRQNRDREMPAWNIFTSVNPLLFVEMESAPEGGWMLPGPQTERSSRAGAEPMHTEEDESHAEAAMDSPLTLDSACRVLGVTSSSTREQIRTAYRRMASRYHPDRLAGREDREQKLAGDRMATINRAYQYLCAGSAVAAG